MSDRPTFKREPLTQDEATQLANACETGEEKLVVWSLLDTGLRVHEFASLSKHHVDWQTHRLQIRGKGKKLRTIPMSARIQRLIEGHISVHDHIGICVRKVQNIVNRVANRAKISRPCSPHILRHTFAVTALDKGVSLAALQNLLGHSNLQTTAIYLNLSNGEACREFNEKW